MSAQPMSRLPSEDVILSAPMSYSGSAQRIMRLRRRAEEGSKELAAITVLAVTLVVIAWAAITVWYLVWGIWLVPYRLFRRSSRKHKVEAMRHRELMGTIQGSAAASASAIVTATAGPEPVAAISPPAAHSPTERVGDADREAAIAALRVHMLDGRLTQEEFEERLGWATSARTRADLDAVRADLPEVPDPRADGMA